MTNDELQKIKDDLGKISKWPWVADIESMKFFNDGVLRDKEENAFGNIMLGENFEFIALCPSRIDALVREVESLQKKVEEESNRADSFMGYCISGDESEVKTKCLKLTIENEKLAKENYKLNQQIFLIKGALR